MARLDQLIEDSYGEVIDFQEFTHFGELNTLFLVDLYHMNIQVTVNLIDQKAVNELKLGIMELSEKESLPDTKVIPMKRVKDSTSSWTVVYPVKKVIRSTTLNFKFFVFSEPLEWV